MLRIAVLRISQASSIITSPASVSYTHYSWYSFRTTAVITTYFCTIHTLQTLQFENYCCHHITYFCIIHTLQLLVPPYNMLHCRKFKITYLKSETWQLQIVQDSIQHRYQKIFDVDSFALTVSQSLLPLYLSPADVYHLHCSSFGSKFLTVV
jgi:hypothetical protein